MGQITYKFDELPVAMPTGDGELTVLISGQAEIDFSSCRTWEVDSATLDEWSSEQGKFVARTFLSPSDAKGDMCRRIERALRSELLSDIEDEIDAMQDGIRCRAYDREIA